SMDERVQVLLQRTGFLDEIGADHVYWSADKAILALGVDVMQVAGGEVTAVAQPPIMETITIAPFAEKMEKTGDDSR
ncbi:MAG: hypothetical protein KA362_05045, partial [Chloroflexi bacterium]|nr:hypothetical protein [Chloroflexota bacterium]